MNDDNGGNGVVGGSIEGGNNGVVGGSINQGGHHDHSAGTVRSFAETLGDGVTTVFAVAHNLGTTDTTESVYNPLTGLQIVAPAVTIAHTSANVTTFTFAVAPAAGAARVVIHA
jgi:hypothetical protein